IILDGFFIPNSDEGDDFGTGEELENKTYVNRSHWSDLLPEICEQLPPHLPRFLAGVWQPRDIAIATKLGIDLFDGSLPYRLTRSAIAWIYPGWSGYGNKDDSADRSSVGRHFFIVFPLDEANITNSTQTPYTSPIQANCDCFTCLRHTQGYISHLHVAKEMLGPMLLMIHNSHQYYRFFEDLRLAASTDRLDDFIQFTQPMRFPCELLAIDKTNESKGVNDSTLDDATLNVS
ncbi:queuine tRNA-ribosyltransferase subunit QTRTD1, partial [Paragonimus westermani]